LDRADRFVLGTSRPDLLRLAKDLRADLDLVQRLERNRGALAARSADGMALDFGPTDAAYVAAFAAIDVDPFRQTAAESGDRLRARSVPVQLAAALDDWAAVRRFQKDEPGCLRLLAVARAADPDPWRNKLRDAVEQQDRAALEALASDPAIREQPAVSRALLGKALIDVRSFQSAVTTLEDARWQFPGDFWINYHLGHACQPAGRLNDAVRFITAAAALSGDNETVDLKLAFLLTSQKSHAEAVVALRRVMRSPAPSYAAYDLLCQNLQALGDNESALAAREKAYQLAPSNYKYLHLFPLVHTYLERSEFRRVAELYDQAVALMGESVTVSSALSALRQRLSDRAWRWVHPAAADPNDPHRAIEWATRLAAAPPEGARLTIPDAAKWNAIARVQAITVGVARYRLGEWDQSIASLQASIPAAAQRNSMRQLYYAKALGKAGQLSEGQKVFDAAIRTVQLSYASNREFWPVIAEGATLLGRSYPPTLRDPPDNAVLQPGPALKTPSQAAAVVPEMLMPDTNQWRGQFTWEPVDGATNYHLQVRPLLASEPLLADHALYTLPRAILQTPVPKPAQRTTFPGWKWRVRALVNDTWTAWSEERMLRLHPPNEN
jgi:tetratricopeptide (TPR) repeat protein